MILERARCPMRLSAEPCMSDGLQESKTRRDGPRDNGKVISDYSKQSDDQSWRNLKKETSQSQTLNSTLLLSSKAS